MSDYISREEALLCATGIYAEDSFEDGIREAECKKIAKRLKELKPVDVRENRWIPVSERLPEEREWYLAVFKEKGTNFHLIPRVADYIGGGENKWRWIDEEGLTQEYFDLLECVAWMPLPSPWKGEEE